MKTETKEKSLQVLEKELDLVFSEFIRLRDSENGRVKCFICGASMPWRQSQNMHYIGRDQMPTRYDEENCHAGCEICNCRDSEHKYKYRDAMLWFFGAEVVDAIRTRSKSLAKFMRIDLIGMIEHYKSEVSKLKRLKGL